MTVPSAEQSERAEYRVGSVAALERGETILVDAGDTEVALFLCRGQVVATQGQCPHAGGPLHEGEVEGTVLTCPWHGWSFDLTTGGCEEDDSMHLARYPVRIDGDDIFVAP
ncbi:Rieske (2Fe-2S) protein [Novosphingobium sp. JCM 18896]|uniref:Rieske (2Fe-2S) protein n=1 Tax=Novosphingobium sp. JCM 18896 TaxID=2989731 RepID=UPI0022227F54|nr:Rieske 2Fe-2S domain-containing protein [Novosphingobium sp. JCM 18896]MCW1432322.1 Rieske 2Fe-2S domain-containing protein [Novosphingobium sp. JCM 18896]